MWTIEEATEVIRRRMRKRTISPESLLTAGGSNIAGVDILSPTMSIYVRPTDSMEVDIDRVERAFDYVIDDMNAVKSNTTKDGEPVIIYVSDIRFNHSSMGSETITIELSRIPHSEWYNCTT